jgi:hypothetical protein
MITVMWDAVAQKKPDVFTRLDAVTAPRYSLPTGIFMVSKVFVMETTIGKQAASDHTRQDTLVTPSGHKRLRHQPRLTTWEE